MKKAFTLVELMVAVGILAIILSFAGIVFNASIGTYRTASANAEIMRKLRAITDQLDADFQGLRKDGEIFVVWRAVDRRPDFSDCDLDGFERFDRIMFFALADPDFQSYHPTLETDGVTTKMVRGNLARICYQLATTGGVEVRDQAKTKRVLARTQHIFTADTTLPFVDPNAFVADAQWETWNNSYEYDKISLEQWKQIPWDQKEDIISVIAGPDVVVADSAVGRGARGAKVDPANPNSLHMLLCEGVGEFKVQGWSYDSRLRRWRWVPEVDPNEDRDLSDRDFVDLGVPDPNTIRVLYPYRRAAPTRYGYVRIRNFSYPATLLNEANFNNIPGLGRALKFTFTLFDSKGIIKQGRTFTHIVYLDK